MARDYIDIGSTPADEPCAAEQGVPDRATQSLLMMEMGGEVEDHLCDQVEDPNLGFQCRCGCRRR
jgi:hypothetical protein